MKKYWAIFRIRFINSLQYRAVAAAHIITRFLWAIMEILLFTALYRAGGDMPLPLSQTVSYLWMQQTCIVLFAVVFGDQDIYSTLADGSIAYDLVRPIGLYGRWFCQSAANRLAFTLMQCLPALLPAFFLPAPYRMTLPAGAFQLPLFFVSAALGLCVVVSFAMLMYISMFYLLSQRGIKVIVTAVTSFLSGAVIPLPFFPESVLRVVKWLPFTAMQNMPLQIFAGSVAGLSALRGILFQAAWLIVLVCLGRLFMQRALGRVVVQGG